MRWNHGLAYVFGGLFWANTLPHLLCGVSGTPFPSPFASPPGVGLSPPTINVAWGLFNLFVGYLLVYRVGSFDARNTKHIAAFGLGFAAMALQLGWYFGQHHGGA
jgi:hypothetical protein